MATVYLNIGTPKTGTTAIQSFLRENEALLNRLGYCFPELSHEVGIRGYKDRNGHFLICNAGSRYQYDEVIVREKGFRAVERLAGKYSNIILSDEELWKSAGKREGLWQLIDEEFRKIGCEMKIIVYLRRQDLFIQSLWNQNVKSKYMRRTESFEECMEQNVFRYFPLNYYRHLSRMTKYLKKENIIVRPYEEGQFEGAEHSIFSDFFQCIGLALTEEYTRETVRRNPGLRGNFLEIKRIINGVPRYREIEDFMETPLRLANEYKVKNDLHADHSMFASHGQQVEFLKKYEKSNRKVAEEFLGREDGTLFYDQVKELPVWKLEPDVMYRDLTLVVTEIFCQQEQKIRELQRDVKRIEGSRVFRMLEKAGRLIK